MLTRAFSSFSAVVAAVLFTLLALPGNEVWGATPVNSQSHAVVLGARSMPDLGAHRPTGGNLKILQAVLYDQSTLPSSNGVAAQNFETSLDAYDCEGADDFLVGPGAGWRVEGVYLPGSYSTSPAGGPVQTVNIAFYRDSDGAPGSAQCSGVGDVVSDQSGSLLVQLREPCVLAQGRYWLGAQANLNSATNGQWYWAASAQQVGGPGLWRNPGNGFGSGCTSWGTIIHCTSLTAEVDYLFRLLGTVEGAGGAPTAAFTWSPAAPRVGEPVQFSDTSTGAPTHWLWSFGDGAVSQEQNPAHTYATAGAMTVTLGVVNDFGSGQVSQTVTVSAGGGQITGGSENQASPQGVDAGAAIASATDRHGNRVVVWQQNAAKVLTSDGLKVTQAGGIFGRVFNSQDQPGAVFSVDTTSGGNVTNPTVAFDGAGNFVVGWEKTAGSGGIFGRTFGSDQQPLGQAFQASDQSGVLTDTPATASNAAGAFVMVWRQGSGKVLQGADGVFGRTFNPDGSPTGSSFRIDTAGTAVTEISVPAVGADAAGRFFVVWHQRAAAKANEDGIFGRLFDPSGNPSGTVQQINDLSGGDPANPAVGVSAQGDAVVVWQQQVGGNDVLCARRYDSSGQAVASSFKADSSSGGTPESPSVAVNAVGDTAVAWTRTTTSGTGVYGRFFTADGQPLGEDFVVATQDGAVVPGGAKASIAGDNTVTVAYTKSGGATTGVFYRTFTVVTVPTACVSGSTTLCLNNGRFQVDVSWRDFSGNTGSGQAVPLTDDTGYLWFFNADNVELVVKVLDGRAVNGYFWVFYGALSNVEYTMTVTDTQTGSSVAYYNPSGTFASVGDTAALSGGGKATSAYRDMSGQGRAAVGEELLSGDTVWSELLRTKAIFGTCTPSATALCLNNNRFKAEVTWRDFSGGTGTGQAVPLTGDTGTFWFFNSANVELILKVLDGRAINGAFWVFYGALSNVQYTIRVTDTDTGQVREYVNPLGQFGSVGDTTAFPAP